jgi:hypothetical protein
MSNDGGTEVAIRSPLSLSISVEQKLNLGNYNSAGVFVSMSGVTAETTEDEMNRLLANGRLAWDKLRADLATKVAEIKQRRLGDAT